MVTGTTLQVLLYPNNAFDNGGIGASLMGTTHYRVESLPALELLLGGGFGLLYDLSDSEAETSSSSTITFAIEGAVA